MPTDCPICGGPGVLLGALGKSEHYRCRNCGATFYVEPEDDSPTKFYPENDNGRPED